MKVEAKNIARSVLVIGADKPFLYVLQNKLSAKGYDADHAYDRERALKLIEERSFDLVLLDLMVSGIDGFTLLEKIKRSKETKVVILSSLEQPEDKEKAESFGLSGFMNKSTTSIPFLIKEVDKILAG